MVQHGIGRQIGDFALQEIIGHGPMSVVYRAVQQSVNRSVAVKVINFAANPLIVENYQPYFVQEARRIAMLEHIHIVPLYNYGEVDSETSFIAMRLLHGGSAADLINAGPVPLETALGIFAQVAEGLAHAHSQGILHRDLKPTNILMDDIGNAYLSDFGLGKLAEVSLDLTAAGHVIGTALYAAPEQLTGDDIDARSDIYSMGAILYHLLVGRPPFEMEADGLAGLIRRQRETRPPAPGTVNSGIPTAVDNIVMKALEHDPEQRFDTINALAEALNEAFGPELARAGDTTVDIAPPVEQPRARRQWPALTALFIVLFLGLIILWMATSASAPTPTVIADARGTVIETQPSEAEIALARERLGDDGFIAFIACTLDNNFQAARTRDIADRAQVYGIATRVYDSQLDPYRQITLIERARLEGAKAMIVCALDFDALDSTLASAQQAGIPLVFVTPRDETFGGVVIEASNFELGAIAGRFAGEIIRDEMGGEANVIILDFEGLSSSEARARGMEAGLLELAPEARIIGHYPGVSVENGANSVRELLSAGINFDVILSMDDASAVGAIAALEEAGVPYDEVAIVSINGEERAQQAIQEGRYLRGTVWVDRELSSRMAVDAAVRLLGAGTLPEILDYPPGELITAANLTGLQTPEDSD